MNRRPLRIGYLNQDFPPEVGAGPARVLELSRYWRDAGAEVTVITGMPMRRLPGSPEGQVPERYRKKVFLEEEWEGLRVLRSWVYSPRSGGFFQTVLNNASFMVTAALHGLWKAGPLDVMIASSPPFLSGVSGESIRLLRGVPLVLELRDMWPDYMVEMGLLENAVLRRSLFNLERYLLRKARHTVVVTESFRSRVEKKGVAKERISVFPNAADLEFYHREESPRSVLPELERDQGEFIVGYLGNFGAGQDLRTVIRAAAKVEDRAPQVRFVLVGGGKEKKLVEGAARRARLSNLSLYPPIPKEDTRAFYNRCDLCLVPLAPVSIFGETIPSKLFEMMACERPILASLSGEGARIVEESGAGMVVPPGDAGAMADAVVAIQALAPGRRREMGRSGREHIRRHFSRATIAERYLELLQRIADGPAVASDGVGC